MLAAHLDSKMEAIRDTPLVIVAETMTVCLRITLTEGITAPPGTRLPTGPDLTALALWSKSSTMSLICNKERTRIILLKYEKKKYMKRMYVLEIFSLFLNTKKKMFLPPVYFQVKNLGVFRSCTRVFRYFVRPWLELHVSKENHWNTV